jgi:hypothetical protein
MKRLLFVVGVLAGAVVLAAPLNAPADSGGLAWDSVTKIMMGAQQSSPQPGSFENDFSAASAVQLPAPAATSDGGMFGQIAARMAAGQTAAQMMQMLQSGMAMRQYVAGSKVRTDMLALQTAMIFDCSARTLTMLNLRDKTYRVTSIDRSPGPNSTNGNTPAASGNPGTRIAMTVNNTALGARDFSGLPTNGFHSNVTMTETSSSGQSHTQTMDLTSYYSSYANPAEACAREAASAPAAGRGSNVMSGYAQLMRVLGSAGSDPRFSIRQSGPPLPLGKLAMYEAVTYGAPGGSATFVTERGHVRPIDSNDPVFSIPAGFTQQQ